MTTQAQDDEKHRLEKAAMDWFLRSRTENWRNDWQIIAFRHQERPDAVLADIDGNLLGLEIAHLYYDDQEAKLTFGRSDTNLSGVQSPSELIRQLDLLVQKKAKAARSYSCPFPIWLLVRVASPIWLWSDFDRELRNGSIAPPQGVFDQVWLLARNDQNLEEFRPLRLA